MFYCWKVVNVDFFLSVNINVALRKNEDDVGFMAWGFTCAATTLKASTTQKTLKCQH